MKKNLFAFFGALLCLLSHKNASAQLFGKKKKQAPVTNAAPAKPYVRESDYDRLLKGAQKATSNFVTLYKVKEKLYFEIPVKYLNREMLVASTLSEVSDNAFGAVGYKANNPLHVKFVVEDSVAFIQQLNVRVTSDDNTDGGKEAISKNFGTSVIAKSRIEAWSKDSSAIVVDFTNLFVSDFKPFGFLPKGGFLSGEFKRDNSALGAIKAFDDNFSITSTMSYDLSITVLFFTLLDKYPMSAKVTRSFLLLPEEKMKPRIADARVGIFPTDKLQFSQQKDGSFKYALANRWRLEPSNPEAYARGEKVAPVKPILFYVDNAFPEKWKEPIRKSVLRWNTAFEAIGFKDAVQVKDFPVNDPGFDPDNLKYSCIRYLPSSTENAMGPSWVDPATGEIISATVLVYNDVVRLLNKWRYVQTAQLDESIRSGKLTDELFNESLEYVVGHEVGHCLGFMHNMASSNAFPVDSLRSASFTQQYGTTPSIMDYARFNYVAQPQDKQVKLTPPVLGEYDYFLVKWNYQPVSGTKNEWDEQATLESWVDAKAGDPIYRYGKQQILSRYDPSSIEEDLGNDPVKASEYGILNLKYILSNLDNWVKDDPDFSYRQGIYDEISLQYYRYIRNVLYNIGGIYLNDVKDGTAGKLHQSVPKDLQQNALKWTLKEYRNADWLNNAQLRKKLPLGLDPSVSIRGKFLGDLKKLTKNVLLSSHISDSPYGVGEYLNDLFAGAFEGAIAGRKLSASDIGLQNFIADMTLEPFEEKKSAGLFGLTDQAFSPSIDEVIAYDLDPTGFVKKYASQIREIESKEGDGALTTKILLQQFGDSPGFQKEITTAAIDNTKLYLLDIAQKIQKLVNAKAKTATGDDRLHYQALALRINKVLKNN
ncbi:zinc-dependent metalloprotease [Pseudobacter ginsenosidimutans]|uniref:Uncharacterized protein DUF5118 n=1 Tax=Pseudobacter ginsenosidimutans TaxID=661488 RepID=A0A4Q7N1G1_9BACT|nr:zinc-dependent metalloprotease [Pseudobacter ginsenosidimutans]QEC44041.1 zinc-dependent metalloprotease [Pseudobacter ginsenosidimutans]RZS75481.1 uncharacterized protein DUF5118 [Pseudobacter ginsenosidimutans]